jgi:hypothetical protein
MTQLRKDMLLKGDLNLIWALIRDVANPADAADPAAFRLDEGHVSREHQVIVDEASRRLTYVLSERIPAEGNLQVQNSAGGYCRIVWTMEGETLPADLDAQMSSMGADLYASVLSQGGGDPPPIRPTWLLPGKPRPA